MSYYPFTAVVGQALFKQALILAAINPAVGGVLICGPRGAAKSTLSRAIAGVMPSAEASFVTLPLGASEEMLVGSLDLQKVLDQQQVVFQPGLLAKADGGILYVDEVNLLPDALVDQLLDVAASKRNIIERDGVSHQHSTDFVLLGTMNPDEGELRAQLLDRFGLCVPLDNDYSIEQRVEIVTLREQFDSNPDSFLQRYDVAQQQLKQQLLAAQQRLPAVQCSQAMRLEIAAICQAAAVDGLRADIVCLQAAKAHAAWQRRDAVCLADINAVTELVLNHRRRNPSNTPPPPFNRPDSSPEQSPSEDRGEQSVPSSHEAGGEWGAMSEQVGNMLISSDVSLAKPLARQQLDAGVDTGKSKGASLGRQQRSWQLSAKVDWFTTLVKSAGVLPLTSLAYKRARGGLERLHLIVLDTSASVVADQGFYIAKAAAMDIVEQAYLKREKVAIVCFGQQRAYTLMPAVKAPKDCREFLDGIAAGGGTPMQKMLQFVQSFLLDILRRSPAIECQRYLFTDGRSSQSFDQMGLVNAHELGPCTVFDIEQSAVKRGRCEELAECLTADYRPLLIA